MPYHVSLTNLASQQRYEVVVVDELDGMTARHLSEWIDAARLNPSARFHLDFSEARWVDPRALQRLLRRHQSLRSEGRLELSGEPRPAPAATRLAAVVPGSTLLVAEPLLTACL